MSPNPVSMVIQSMSFLRQVEWVSFPRRGVSRQVTGGWKWEDSVSPWQEPESNLVCIQALLIIG